MFANMHATLLIERVHEYVCEQAPILLIELRLVIYYRVFSRVKIKLFKNKTQTHTRAIDY